MGSPMNHVIYFHGFASSPNTNKVAELQQHFSVFAPSVPHSYGHDQLITQVKNYLSEHVNVGEKVVFCGTSLGAYFAAYMGHLFDAPALVINPSVDPYIDLQKFQGINTNYSTGENFELSQKDIDSFRGNSLDDIGVDDNQSVAIVCSGDSIVDPVRAVSLFKNTKLVNSDDHRFIDTEMIVSELKLMFDSPSRDNFSEGDF
jgi:hypothetical protein